MGSFWRGVLFGNLRTKGIAFFFAVVIWFFAYQNQLEESDGIPVPYRIEVRPPAQGEPQWTVVRAWSLGRDATPQPFDGKVFIGLAGPRTKIHEYSPGRGKQIEGIRYIDVDPAGPPDEEVRTLSIAVEPKDFRLPRWEAVSVDPKRIVPGKIEVELNRIRVREVPIQPQVPPYKGIPDRYWQRDESRPIVFDPPTVKIKGPARALAEIPVRAEAPDIGRGRIRDPESTFQVPLAPLPRPDVVFVDKPAVVRMTIPFNEIAILHVFKDVPLKVVLPAPMRTKDGTRYRLECEADRVSLKLKVSPEDAKRVQERLANGKAWVYFEVREDPPLNEPFPISASEIQWAPGEELPDVQINYADTDTPTYRLVPLEVPKPVGP